MCVCKEDLALNNLQWLIYKIQPNQTKDCRTFLFYDFFFFFSQAFLLVSLYGGQVDGEFPLALLPTTLYHTD